MSVPAKIGGPAAVILATANRLPPRLPEDEIGADALSQAIERRILRVAAQSDGPRWTSAEEVAAALDRPCGAITEHFAFVLDRRRPK